MCEALKGNEWLKATLLSSPDQEIAPGKLVTSRNQTSPHSNSLLCPSPAPRQRAVQSPCDATGFLNLSALGRCGEPMLR